MFTLQELKLYALETIKESDISKKDKLSLIKDLKESDLYKTMAFLNKGQMLKESIKIDETFEKKIKSEFNKNSKLLESIQDYHFDVFLTEDCSDILNEVEYMKTSPKRDFFSNTWRTKKYISGDRGKIGIEKISRPGRGQSTKPFVNLTKKGKSDLKTAGVVAGVVAALLILKYGSKIYKRYLTQAGKVCGKLKGDDKINCENKLKVEGLRQAISKIESLKSKCAKSKDPEKCKSKIDEKINSYKNKLSKYQIAVK